MKRISFFREFSRVLTAAAILGTFGGYSSTASAQGYEAFSVLGTSQALCRPGIETADQLQAFFNDNPDLVNEVLSDANWQGNPQDLFDAIAAGDFSENLYEPGSKFEWTSFQDGGVGMHKPRRVWAGEEAFRGFEVSFTSNCEVHTMVIPLACCNVSLVGTTKVAVEEPEVTINAENETARICAPGAQEAVITQSDGTRKTVSLDSAGCWTGELVPGAVSVTATNTNECGVASGAASYNIAATPLPEEPAPAKPSLLPYVGAFYGDETRQRYEPDWDMYFEDDSEVVGVFGGLMKPLTDTVMLFGQVGYADRSGVSDRFVAPDDTLFLDIGVDKYFGPAFIGGGVGIWNLNEDDMFRDGSLFVHGGSYLGQSNFQLYLEGRVFTDELDNTDSDNLFSGGVRYIFK